MVFAHRFYCIAKQPNSSNNGARNVEFSSRGGGENYEHSSASLVEISEVFAAWDYFFGTEPFDRVQLKILSEMT